MKHLRNLAYFTAAIAYALIVLGAVVRISGSGMGCGDHWPMCNGHWFPPLDDLQTVIEWSHRLVAATLGVPVLLLAGLAYTRRNELGGSGPGGTLYPAQLAVALLVIQALLGAITVWLDLHTSAVLLHLGTAMLFIATLMVVAFRAGAMVSGGGPPPAAVDRSSHRSALAALVLGGITVLLGGVTATTGAAGACVGFPLCNGQFWPGAGSGGLTHIQWTHRLLAYGLFLHLVGVVMAGRKRQVPAQVRTAALVALAVVLLQVIVAAAMVLQFLPASLRGLHAAVGTAVWVALVWLAWEARRTA